MPFDSCRTIHLVSPNAITQCRLVRIPLVVSFIVLRSPIYQLSLSRITLLDEQDPVVIFKLTEFLGHGLFSLLLLIFVMLGVWAADSSQRNMGR